MIIHKPDEKIREEIQLELRWMPGGEPKQVAVAVEQGGATLSGEVGDEVSRHTVE